MDEAGSGPTSLIFQFTLLTVSLSSNKSLVFRRNKEGKRFKEIISWKEKKFPVATNYS